MNATARLTSRVLVVEDEPLIAMLMQDWLDKLQCETVGPASSVAAALELIGKDAVDGAILDVSLGSGDCFPVADELARRSVPFVFATGRGADSLPPRFAGSTVLAKPFEYNVLKDAVASFAKRSPRPAG